jgi:hypothetical protein
MNMSPPVHLKKADIVLLKNGVVKICVHENVQLEVEDVKEIHETKKAIIGCRQHAVLLIAGKFSTISKEAREFSAKAEISGAPRLAKAIVINSLAQRITGIFFIRIDKPVAPVQLFTNEEDAFLWLKKFTL